MESSDTANRAPRLKDRFEFCHYIKVAYQTFYKHTTPNMSKSGLPFKSQICWRGGKALWVDAATAGKKGKGHYNSVRGDCLSWQRSGS